MKGIGLAIALLLLAAASAHGAGAEEAGREDEMILGFTYEGLATVAIVGMAAGALSYGVYVLAFGGDPLLGLGAGAIGTVIAVEIGILAAEAGVIGGSYYLWTADEEEDPL
jgi:hypothetical protein